MKYINKTPFQNGIRLTGQTPLDDRTVIESKSELYITTSAPGNCALYNKAYEGLIVSVADENYETYICINATPYTVGKVVTVNAGNLATYWKRSEQTVYDYVHTEVDNYIKSSHIKVNSQWITCSSSLETSGIKGINYVFNASIDGDTLKSNASGVLSGWKFKLNKEELASDSPYYSVYDLKYWQPGATSWQDDPVKIEIPKVQVLKSVKLCKAVADSSEIGGYRVTIYRDNCTEEQWQAAQGDVYLRVEWDNDESAPATDITYLNVAEIITIDVDPLRVRLTSLESSTHALEVSTNALEVRANRHDSSINYLQNRAVTFENDIDDISNNLSTLKDEYDASMSKAFSMLSTLNASVNDVCTRVDTNFSTLNSSIVEVYGIINEQIASAISSVDTSINYLQNRAVTFENDIDDISNNVNTLKNEYDASMSNALSMLSILNASVNEVSTRLSDVSNFSHNVSTYIDTHIEPNLLKIDSSIVEIYGIISDQISSALSIVNTSINFISDEISTNVAILNSSISNLNTSINSLDSALDTLRGTENSHYVSLNNYVIDLSTREGKHHTAQDASIVRIDASMIEIFRNYYEQNQLFAAAWGQFKASNPSLNWTNMPYNI